MKLFQHHNPEGKNFSCVGLSDIGLVRKTNQDCLVEAGNLAGVADGMGGHLGGEVASADARDAVSAFVADKTPGPILLRQAIEEANRAVYEHAKTDEALSGMGTTLTVLWVGETAMYLGHVGDSRCYLWRDGKLQQMSEDHSMVMEMVRLGLITPAEAAVHPMRNVITRAVGVDPTVEVDTAAFPRQKGDLWLICSDGLHGMVEDEGIAEILHSAATDREAAEALVQAALTGGGRDNVTVMLLRDERGPAKEGDA